MTYNEEFIDKGRYFRKRIINQQKRMKQKNLKNRERKIRRIYDGSKSLTERNNAKRIINLSSTQKKREDHVQKL